MNSSSNPEVSIDKSIFLKDKGHQLRTEVLNTGVPCGIERPVSPDYLKVILNLGRKAILDEEFYRLYIVHLANTEQTDGVDSQVYTEAGYNNDTGIHELIDEIQSSFHPYWHAVEEAGFIPEVRSTTTKNCDGSWLLLGRDTDES